MTDAQITSTGTFDEWPAEDIRLATIPHRAARREPLLLQPAAATTATIRVISALLYRGSLKGKQIPGVGHMLERGKR